MSILLGLLTGVLILVSLFLVMVVLMQKSKDGGMGAALGGGAAEAAFGAETSNVLSRSTIYAAILFFVIGCVLVWQAIAHHDWVYGAFAGITFLNALMTRWKLISLRETKQ